MIQSASVQDRDGAAAVVTKLCESWKKVVKIFADGGYRGKLIDTIKTQFKIELEIIKRNELHGKLVNIGKLISEGNFNNYRMLNDIISNYIYPINL